MIGRSNKQKAMRLLYLISDPQIDKSLNFKEVMQNKKFRSSLIKFAELNGLYYYCMEFMIGSGVVFSDIERAKWNKELDKMRDFKNTIEYLNSLYLKYELRYILIKACTKIPHVPRDVDIFVSSNDKERYIKAFDAEGLASVYSNPVETAFCKEGLLKLDIYCDVRYIGIRFMSDTFLWDSRINEKINGINCIGLNDNANFLLLLVHSIFGHRRMTLLDFLHLKSMLLTIDRDFCRNHAREMGWETAFNLLLNKIEELDKLAYSDDNIVIFPYLFERSFIYQCLDSIEVCKLTKKIKIFLYISILLDRFQHELAGTSLYDLLLKISLGRKCYNSFCYFIRNHRGDRHGIYK